jgi:cytochrome c peroxidase
MKLKIIGFFCLGLMAYSGFKTLPKKKTIAMQQLGRLLFFDERLSANKKMSCATCHQPSLAFTDGKKTAIGTFGDTVPRNTPTILNLANNKFFNWANDKLTSLQLQANNPLFGIHPIEMGLDSNSTDALQFARADNLYMPLLQQLSLKKLNYTLVKDAIAAYTKTLTSRQSKYDKFRENKAKLTTNEMAGMALFFSDDLLCARCHNKNDFDEPANPNMFIYQNIGLYNVDTNNFYGNGDNGLYKVTNDKEDMGRFKIPSLRNVAITAPYFHDGSAKTLSEVIAVYANAGRNITEGKNKGNGIEHPNKHPLIQGFTITDKQKQQLISFLNTLTDTSYTKSKWFNNPFN